MSGQVVIISAPSGTGKSIYIKKMAAQQQASGKIILVCRADKIQNLMYSYIRRHNTDNLGSLSTLLGISDIYVFEDIDIYLSGKEFTQKEFARIIIETAHEGKQLYLTGIDIPKRVEHFFEMINSYYPDMRFYTSVPRPASDKN